MRMKRCLVVPRECSVPNSDDGEEQTLKMAGVVVDFLK